MQNFDAEVSAVVAETVWDSSEKQRNLSETIVEHLYRQGMLSVAEDLCQVRLYKMVLYRTPSVALIVKSALFCSLYGRAGVGRGHRHEHEAAVSGTEPHS